MIFKTTETRKVNKVIPASQAIPGYLYEVVDNTFYIGFSGHIVLILGSNKCKGMMSLTNPEHYWDDISKNDLLLRPLDRGDKFTIEQE